MKFYLLVLSLLFCIVNSIIAQSQGSFGFTNSKIPLAATNLNVKPATNIVSTKKTRICYVNNIDGKIHDISWTPISGWTASPSWLGGSSAKPVKANIAIINNEDDIYYVGNDNKIHQVKLSGGLWMDKVLLVSQLSVSGNNIVYFNGHIYYVGKVGTNYNICDIFSNDGVNWSGGNQLIWTPTVSVKPNTQIIATDVHVYYIGVDDKIYNCVWDGSTWQGGTNPLNNSLPLVQPGTRMTNDLNHLFYVGKTSKRVCELIWNSSSGWNGGPIWTPLASEPVRDGTNMICYDSHIFYVSDNQKKVCDLEWSASNGWTSKILNTNSDPAKINTQLFVSANDIIEEGTINTTFKSYHVFYTGLDNKINMLVYDDKRVEFESFGCYDPCDGNNNGTGWDNPLPSVTPHPSYGYNCAQYVGMKEWYFGKIPMESSTVASIGLNNIIENKKHFFYIAGNDQNIYDFLRPQINGLDKPGYNILWADEFNTFNANNWAKSFNGWNHNPNECYDIFWNEPSNVSVLTSGSLSIKLENLSSNPINRYQDVWVGNNSCFSNAKNGVLSYWKDYGFTTGVITTDKTTNNILLKEYQFIESRFKIPRGNRFWTGFWFPKGGDQDINFEFDGNGKCLLLTMYDIPERWTPGIVYYAVGFRFYDDFYTYGLKWGKKNADDNNVYYYFNNELIATKQNYDNHCKDEREVILNVELSDPNIHAACEPAFFPSSFDIDYVRIWQPQ